MAIYKRSRRDKDRVEVIATNNVANILVDDPRLVDTQQSLAEILYKIGTNLQELRNNVAWLYEYGGTGSGSGGGGNKSGSDTAKFECLNKELTKNGSDDIIYISDNKIMVKYRIFQKKGSELYSHSVFVNGVAKIKGQPLKSNQDTYVTLSDLSITENNVIRFSAETADGYNIDDYTLKIISGSISIVSSTVKNNGSISHYYGTGDIEIDYSIINRVKGASTVLEIKLNNLEDTKLQKTFNIDGTINYRLKVMEQLNNGNQLETGVGYTVTAQAFTVLNGVSIPSEIYTFVASLLDNKSLIVTTNGISEMSTPDDDLNLKTYSQGSDLSFYYTLNAASYNSFRCAFEIVTAKNEVLATIGSIYPPGRVFDKVDTSHDLWLDNKLVFKDVSNNFSYSTNKIDREKLGILYVRIYAWSSDGTLGSGIGKENEPIKIVKCKIERTDKSVPSYTSNKKTCFVNLDCPQNFSDYQDKSIITLKEKIYNINSDIVDHVQLLTLHDTNGVGNGIIKNKLTDNNAALRVSGESYAHLNLNYFNETNLGSWSVNNSGFTFSLTFKCDNHPNDNGTIFSYGNYDNNGELISGIDVSLELAKLVYIDGSKVRTVSKRLIQNTLTTIDFVCEKKSSEGVGFMKIYIDGVCEVAGIIENINKLSLGLLNQGAYIGCKKVNGKLTNFCDVNVHNLRIYQSSLEIPDLVNNYIINHAFLHKLEDGSFNYTIIDRLKEQNFIDPNWNCTLWDYSQVIPTWKTGNELYSQINANPVMPVLLLSETTPNSTFHDMYNTSYNEANAKAAQRYRAACNMVYKDINGTTIQIKDVATSLQGTSSMSYMAKNLELYFGSTDDGQLRLFTPKDEWIPENQFTLKADVIDSAHANNTVIGEFVNEYFEEIYPMKFSANPYAKKVKHTLEGFPIYLFYKFGDQAEPTFLGIYNFNLGRGSNYNMGFRVLENYKLMNEKAPSLVESYKELTDPYHGGVFSFEFNTNSPTDIVAFQQPDKTIVDYILDQRYPEVGDASQDAGWSRVYQLFDNLSRMYSTTDAPKKWIYKNNKFVETEERLPSQIRPTMEYFPTDWNNNEGLIHWGNANRYLCVALAFGMLDSLGKNMTLRSWNISDKGKKGMFYTAFYDMDTAFGLDNYGNEEVPETTYLDYWYNEEVDGYTQATKIINGIPDGVKGYDMPCSRLWELVRDMIKYDPGNIDMNYQSYWSELRKVGGKLENAKKFMDEHYLKHVKNVGATIYNMDYSTKYLKKYEFENNDGSKVVGYNDLKFLHGTRKNYVLSWLTKRLRYIDSCMNLAGLYGLDGENNQWVSAYPQSIFHDSTYIEQWKGRGNGSNSPMFQFEVLSNNPMLFCMTIATNTQRVLLKDNVPTSFKFKGTNSSSTISWNAINNISKFRGFQQLNFASIGIFSMRKLLELDFSGISSFDKTSQDEFNISQLTELRRLNLNSTRAVNIESGFIINVDNCLKLKAIDVRNSSVGSLSLPGNDDNSIGSGVLSQLLVSNSLITNLKLQNQNFIKILDLSDCRRLTSVDLNSMKNLETVIFGNNDQLQSISISNCNKLKTVTCNGMKNLVRFKIDICKGIEIIDLTDCSNENLEINLNGAYGLKKLLLANVKTVIRPILPSYDAQLSDIAFYDTLTTLDLFNSTINCFDYGTKDNTTVYQGSPILDLSRFNNLSSWNNSNKTGLCLNYCANVKYVKFDNSKSSPIRLSNVSHYYLTRDEERPFFHGCTNLERVFGHIAIAECGTFMNCTKFRLRDPLAKVGGHTPMNSDWKGVDTAISGERNKWLLNFNSLDTNITIATNSLNQTFASTAVSYSDVLYIMTKASGIQSFNKAFDSCNNIVVTPDDSFPRTMFSACESATSINCMFIGCQNISTILYSHSHRDDGTVTAYDGLFAPMKNLNDINHFLYEAGKTYIDDMILWKFSDNEEDVFKVTSFSHILGSNLQGIRNSGVNNLSVYPLKASRLLKYTTRLVSFNHSFYGVPIEFDTVTEEINGETVEYCPLFFNTPNLLSVVNSFGCPAFGNLVNLFGGQAELMQKYPNKFPKAFVTLAGCFNCTPYNGQMVVHPLRNDMFSRIKTTLQRFDDSMFNRENRDSNYVTMKNYVDPALINYEQFPYDIFKGCTALVSCNNFFSGLSHNKPNQTVKLPHTLFRNCTNLQSIEGTFSNLKFRYKLTGGSFTNCRLSNVNNAFSYGYNMEGGIPLRMFYMETQRIKNGEGWQDGDGINTQYGLDSNGEYIAGTKKPTPRTIQYIVTEENRSITSMVGTFSWCNSALASAYHLEIGELTNIFNSPALIKYNEKYNPIKYIPNVRFNADKAKKMIPNPNYDPTDSHSQQMIPNPNYDARMVIENPNYDNRLMIWNEYCTDGTNIRDIVLNSKFYKSTATILSRDLPESYYDEANNKTNNATYTGKYAENHYICPPDLFNYCSDIPGLNLTSVLANNNSSINENYGIAGRIPPLLFDKLTKVTTLNSLFSGTAINPYYQQEITLEKTTPGNMFPPTLLKSLGNNLRDISGLFSWIMFYENCIVPENFFMYNTNIVTMESTFAYCNWKGTDQHIPNTLFIPLVNIQNISNLFGNGRELWRNNHNVQTNSPTVASKLWFTSIHKSISNFSYFMNNCRGTRGSIPEFWTFTNLGREAIAGAFANMSRSRIENMTALETSKYKECAIDISD